MRLPIYIIVETISSAPLAGVGASPPLLATQYPVYSVPYAHEYLTSFKANKAKCKQQLLASLAMHPALNRRWQLSDST